ncbi:MAG TPA: hypothetical protein VEZ44_05390 [bacterium]|nr:hypothetical protein [bacterium]
MKKRLVTAKKVSKSRLVRAIEKGQAPFHGARSRRGAKDAKDLRGVKGLLLKNAEEDVDRGPEPS